MIRKIEREAFCNFLASRKQEVRIYIACEAMNWMYNNCDDDVCYDYNRRTGLVTMYTWNDDEFDWDESVYTRDEFLEMFEDSGYIDVLYDATDMTSEGLSQVYPIFASVYRRWMKSEYKEIA
jgi:hypothetical protein